MDEREAPDHVKPLSKRTDDEIRDRARVLHEEDWVIEIPEDAKVIRPPGSDCVEVEAWISLGEED